MEIGYRDWTPSNYHRSEATKFTPRLEPDRAPRQSQKHRKRNPPVEERYQPTDIECLYTLTRNNTIHQNRNVRPACKTWHYYSVDVSRFTEDVKWMQWENYLQIQTHGPSQSIRAMKRVLESRPYCAWPIYKRSFWTRVRIVLNAHIALQWHPTTVNRNRMLHRHDKASSGYTPLIRCPIPLKMSGLHLAARHVRWSTNGFGNECNIHDEYAGSSVKLSEKHILSNL